jgi:two-component system chemotaxis response regulator CheY
MSEHGRPRFAAANKVNEHHARRGRAAMMNGSEPNENSPLAALRVMVVDDQRAMRAILRELLHKCGIHDVLEAANGEDALHLLARLALKDEKPDIILCDLHMEKMDGMELVNRIRRGKEPSIDRHIPILLLTGESDTMVLGVMEQVGTTEILKKPVSAEELTTAIQQAVGVAAG